MDLFNVFINETNEQLGAPKQKWAYSERDAWKDLGSSELVLMKDAAYELGGSGKSAVNFTCVTDDKSLVSGDEILLYGPDLKDLKADSTFARIAFLGVKEISKDEQEAFNTIQNMEFVKYHVFPEGYMMRVSPESHREQVRVSKKSIKKGISFKSVGADYIKQYHTNPNITAVKLIFVTDPSVDYKALTERAKKVNEVTKTMNKILEGLPEDLDCASCSFKPVCDEVEGLKELHFGKEGMKKMGKK